jgi:hypothetical protein
MYERSIILAVGASLAALVFVLELVRRRRLREDYSLLWLLIGVVMLIISAWRDLLHQLAAAAGIAYPPNLLFLLAALFSMGLLLYYATVITQLTQQNKDLAQQMALLRYEVERLRTQHEERHPAQDN